jgi:putative FmdB family regulatory protein
MPTYEYRCKDCGEDLEVVQAFTDDALTECPTCGGTLRKVFGNIGVSFKGSGFYKTDSRNGSGSKKAKADKSESSDAKGSTESSSTSSDSGSKDSGSKDSGSKDSGSKDSGSKDSGSTSTKSDTKSDTKKSSEAKSA